MDWKAINDIVGAIDSFIYLTFKLNFRTWRNLPYSIKSVIGKDARQKKAGGEGDVSSFNALMTALSATIGTGNIVGVATAMFAGGPGALVWMWLSAAFGITTKYAECMLASKYREVNEKGEMKGGPMFTMKNAFKNKQLGAILGFLFALFTVLASFGIGNMTQANSISTALEKTFAVPVAATGAALVILCMIIILGGIQSISKVAAIVVPVMAVFYVVCGLAGILANAGEIPHGLYLIFTMAFNPQAVVARGCFSNEAGLGSAAIVAASAHTDDPVRQGYINSTGTFFDTIVICSITGLVIASSGMLGTVDEKGVALSGLTLTIAAFEKFVGPVGRYIVSIGIVLFAYSTILGWEYQGEKCFEYLFGSAKFNVVYRVLFCLITYIGATQALFNALMAIPNLISLLVLADIIKEETERYQPILEAEKAGHGVQHATKDEVEELRDMTIAIEEKIEKTQKRLDNLEKKMNKVEAAVNKMRK